MSDKLESSGGSSFMPRKRTDAHFLVDLGRQGFRRVACTGEIGLGFRSLGLGLRLRTMRDIP